MNIIDLTAEENRLFNKFELSAQLLERLGLWHNGKLEYEMVMDRFIEDDHFDEVPNERQYIGKNGKNFGKTIHKYPTWYYSSFWGTDIIREPKNMGSGKFWENFVPQIPIMAIKRFTKKGDTVVDRFAGSGTTLDVAELLDRKCIGIDIYKRREEYLAEMPNQPTNLVVMHPPYADLAVVYGEQPAKLKEYADFKNGKGLSIPPNDFLVEFKKILDVDVTPNLVDDGHVCLVIGDGWRDGEIYPFANRTIELFTKDYEIKHIIVKYIGDWTGRANRAIWEYRALKSGWGVLEHEYVCILKKR